MQIHVARNSAQLGIFAPEDIIAGLSSSRFLASDLAWRDGISCFVWFVLCCCCCGLPGILLWGTAATR